MAKKVFISAATFLILLCHIGNGVLAGNPSGDMNGRACEDYALEDWQPSEKWAWKMLCDGKVADFNQKIRQNLKPENSAFKNEERRIRAAFLKTVLLKKPFVELIDNNGARFDGIWIMEKVDFTGAEIQPIVWLDNCLLEDEIELNHAVFHKTLTLYGSLAKESVNLEASMIKGRLSLNKGRFEKGLNLRDIQITGDLGLNNAIIREEADLSRSKVEKDLSIDKTLFEGAFDLMEASVSGSVMIRDSTFKQDVNFLNTTVRGSFAIQGGTNFHAGLSLGGANIFRNVDISGKNRFAGPVSMTSLKAKGYVSLGNRETVFESNLSLALCEVKGEMLTLSGGTYRGKVQLSASSVVGDLNIDNAIFEKAVAIAQATVGRNISLDGAQFMGPLILARTNVSGNITMEEATFERKVDMQSISVGQHIEMANSIFKGENDFSHMQLAGTLLMAGSRFGGPLNLRNARIGGALWLWKHEHGLPVWESQNNGKGTPHLRPMLDLQSASAKTIVDHPEAWPGELDLFNFAYTQFGSFSEPGAENDLRGREHEWFVNWVGRSQHSDGTYQAQPYLQLSGVLKAMGMYDARRRVLFAAGERKRQSPQTGVTQKVWLLLIRVFTGYGQQLWRAALALALMTIMGAVFLRNSKDGPRNHMPYGLSYSFDKVLPLIKLNDRFERVSLTSNVRYWFYFQQIMGYILATLILASLLGTLE